MVTSTQAYNYSNKDEWCTKLGIDDYEIDWYGNVHQSDVAILYEESWQILGKNHSSTKTRTPPILRWKINNIWYCAVIPIELKTEYWNAGFAGGRYDVIDERKMESVALDIIKNHINTLEY